jgi:prepilin-type N-terminal cleavage/methylation domain-containing protein
MNRVVRVNRRGYTLIEVLIVTVVGLFVLEAAYLLYTGAFKLFKDVKTSADNVQTEVPSMELIGRYFDRWGVNVAATGADCASYPPSNTKCITVTAGTPCDEVSFWGNIYGTGFVQSVSGGVATIVSCRLSADSNHNCHYVWSNDILVNDLYLGNLIMLGLGSLSSNNADCSSLTSSSTLPTVAQTVTPVGVYPSATNKTLLAGDIIQRAPHRIRLYCAANANDNNQNWLYVDLTDTASDCNSHESASPIAPVDSFQVELLPSGCDAGTGACTVASLTVTFRSQSKKYSREAGTLSTQRVFGR